MDSPDSPAPPRKGPSMGASIAIGIVLILAFSGFGGLAWLLWVWARTPQHVRAAVSKTRKVLVVAPIAVCLVAFVLGLAMTVVWLQRSFAGIDGIDPSQKARMLAQGISEAMNFTAMSIPILFLGGVVAFVAGYKLLRAARS